MSRSAEAKKRRAIRYARSQAQVVDAAERRVVRLADGRTGRLLRVPAQSSRRSSGAKVRVELASGAVISVPVDQVTVIG